ncbi:MAG: alpha/beta hydrolase [Chloroflexi bacterium]|nr:alpha/beta hydrolase [Chloroflexota bacterium]MDA1003021.1 alpha/beta hydrolase [Chloroflexota bacterium]
MPTYTTPDGLKINYEESGTGSPTLIMIHGLCSNLKHWDPQVRKFGRTHKILRMDLRGHGKSDAPTAGYTIRKMADDVAALAKSRRIRSAVVLGHSMGGAVALEFTRQYKDIAKALILLDSPAAMGGMSVADAKQAPMVGMLAGPGWPAAAEAFYGRFFTETRDKKLAASVCKDAGKTPQQGAVGMLTAGLTFKMPAAAKAVKQPVLYIAASQGNARWDTLKELMPQIQFARVVGAGHFLQLEAPEQTNPMIEEFLARL